MVVKADDAASMKRGNLAETSDFEAAEEGAGRDGDQITLISSAR